ncbi:hypothetical protein [uncultured Psychrosphaera sp.]|uniref:hypothetical protein n=1 Tax=uncultured Psychrosphaera sp. TaxID=1403522 RepID=UPI002605D457|nr:hypothetical protein [uncultured Psychrosphaera sp.]
MKKTLSKKRYLIVCIVSIFLGACSKSDSTPTEDDTPDVNSTETINITGTIQYERVPFSTSTYGLDYDNIITLPVRGAVVEALDGAGDVVATSTTSDEGTYSVTVPQDSAVQISVKAQTLSDATAKWDIEIRDNTNDGGLYLLQGSLSSSDTSADSIRNLTATTGWDGSSYSGTRASAPFAILDTAYDVVMKIVAVDSNVNMDDVDIFWSKDNSTASGELSDGEIGTSFYSGDQLYILGKEDVDTDEFDDHVIIHELGHYFEDNLSRSDSIGGAHSLDNILDMRVALGEGFGNAFSGMVSDDPIYSDTSGAQQGLGFILDVDDNSNTNPGWYSEGSVQAILYDIYDADEDEGDTVALGFAGIYQAMTSSDYINQTSMTSIFSLIDEVKTLNPTSETAIDTLVEGQTFDTNYGIDPITDKFGTDETHNAEVESNLDVYKSISADALPVKLCSHADSQEYNGLGTRQFLRLDITTAGSYIITADFVATGNDILEANSDPDFVLYLNGEVAGGINGGTSGNGGSLEVGSETSTVSLEEDEYILEVYDYSNVDDDESEVNGTACFNVTVTNS